MEKADFDYGKSPPIVESLPAPGNRFCLSKPDDKSTMVRGWSWLVSLLFEIGPGCGANAIKIFDVLSDQVKMVNGFECCDETQELAETFADAKSNCS